MGKLEHCAYNQTRECFLALEVADGDIEYTRLTDLTAKLSLPPGQGLWIAPFRGIPATGVGILLDLVYLDTDCIVVDVKESFLTSRNAPSNPLAASVLALPHHVIYSSQTQKGDHLMICPAGEMGHRLERLSDCGGHDGAEYNAAQPSEMSPRPFGAKVVDPQDCSHCENHVPPETTQIELKEPRTRSFKAPKSWLEKWLYPDPRRVKREPVRDLAAYYWTGASPSAHSIRDINRKGLYLITEERWYPGTIVLMTLQRTDSGVQEHERSIHLYTKAVRWGKDGVGLQIVLRHEENSLAGQKPPVRTVTRKELDRFLECLVNASTSSVS